MIGLCRRSAGQERRNHMSRSRRGLIGAAGIALAAPCLISQALGQAVERYPDAAMQVLDPSFNRYRLLQASVERLWTGARWSEGPAWFGDQRCLIWSDIPNNRMLRWSEAGNRVDVFRAASNNSNGNTRDRQGRLVTCEHLTR